MIRAIALSLIMLFGIGVALPIATEYVEGGTRKATKTKKAKKKKIRKYSKRWWRLYRARQARRRALLKRKRALRLRQIRIAKQRARARAQRARAARNRRPVRRVRTVRRTAPKKVVPSASKASVVPVNWKKTEASNGAALQFRIDDAAGAQLGEAQISMVGPAVSQNVAAGKAKTIGGVPTSSLRRSVIDQMIRENGWVVNDFQKVVNGRNVYVVLGQFEGPNGQMQSKLFYFTEVNGRIYSVATVSSFDASDRIAEESEKVVKSLVARTADQRANLE